MLSHHPYIYFLYCFYILLIEFILSSLSAGDEDSESSIDSNNGQLSTNEAVVAAVRQEAYNGDDRIADIEEMVESESEFQWDIKEIGVEESVTTDVVDIGSLSHGIGVVTSDSYESSGVVEKDVVSELTKAHDNGRDLVVEKDSDSVSELPQSSESANGVVVEKDSVSELPQSRESASDEIVEKDSVPELEKTREIGGANDDRYVPALGTTVEHRARWWNCCGLLDVFIG